MALCTASTSLRLRLFRVSLGWSALVNTAPMAAVNTAPMAVPQRQDLDSICTNYTLIYDNDVTGHIARVTVQSGGRLVRVRVTVRDEVSVRIQITVSARVKLNLLCCSTVQIVTPPTPTNVFCQSFWQWLSDSLQIFFTNRSCWCQIIVQYLGNVISNLACRFWPKTAKFGLFRPFFTVFCQ